MTMMAIEEQYKGYYTKLCQMIQETQGEIDCFV